MDCFLVWGSKFLFQDQHCNIVANVGGVVATGVTLSLSAEARAQFEKYEAMGMDAVKHTGFVLVAGGLGERLGYSGIKVLFSL